MTIGGVCVTTREPGVTIGGCVMIGGAGVTVPVV